MASLSSIFRPEARGKEERTSQECGTIVERGEEQVEELTRVIELLRVEESKLVRDEVSQQLHQQLVVLESELSKLDDLYKLRSLLVTLEQVKEANNAMQHLVSFKSGKSKHESDLRLIQAVDQFEYIKRACETSIKTCPPDNPLRIYVEKVLVYWNEELMKLIIPKFEATLESLRWPVTDIDSLPDPPVVNTGSFSSVSTGSFDIFFTALLKLDIRPLFVEPNDGLIHVSLPLEIMIKPLKKKFFFHFVKPSRTNRLEKPEWYLTCVLNWIKDSLKFLNRNVEPLLKMQERWTSAEPQLVPNTQERKELVVETQERKWPPAELQLVAGLLALVRTKLKNDLPDLVDDDSIFSHTFDEVYLFVKELDVNVLEGHSLFLKSYVDIFSLFSRDPYFGKLMKLEKRKSSEYVDSILESKSAWNTMNSIEYEEDLKKWKNGIKMNEEEEELNVTEAGDNFVILIQSIIERCEYICDARHKKSFLDLILEVVDDFRLRLSQLVRSPSVSNDKSITSEENCIKWPFCTKYFGILNTLYYLVHVLDEWKDLPPFCEQDYGQEDPFEELISLLKHMIREMQTRIVDSFMNQFSIKLYKYSTLKWQWMNSSDENYHLSGSEVFHFLSTALQKLKSTLSTAIYQPIVRNVSSQVASLFLKEVILRDKNSFNSEGAAKIHKDVKQNLLSLFKCFMRKPEPFLAEILEAVYLLSLSKGAVLLLQEALDSGDAEQCLKDVHVETLPKEVVRAILKKRLFC